MLVVIFLVVFAGAAIWLGTRDMPAPADPVETVIPNERFAD